MRDHDRQLTTHGISQANKIAASLPAIKVAICSTAKRTRMTLENVQAGGTHVQKIIHSDELYNAPAENLLNAIQACGDKETLFLIAHNPGIHQLANVLSAEDGSALRESLRFSYAPASLSVLECPIASWKDIQPQGNKLVDFIVPD